MLHSRAVTFILAERLKTVFAARAKENEIAGGGDKKSQKAKSGSANSPNPKIDTREEIAKIAGVGSNTISKVEKIEAHVIPEIKEQIRRGDISINQGYELAKREPAPDVASICQQMLHSRLNFRIQIGGSPSVWYYCHFILFC
jgi:hypothetical protein